MCRQVHYICKICCLTFQNFLLFDVALVSISVVVAMCVNCWESKYVFSKMNTCKVIQIPSM